MIAAVLGILAMAALFVLAGLIGLGEGKGCGSGHCGSCSNDCELDLEGRRP
ncbi:MAG: hypothetical protein ACYC6F_16505 [Longimicrobiales bacterium]